MRKLAAVAVVVLVVSLAGAVRAADFERTWTHVGETSAVFTWHLGDIKDSALSYVEYGSTQELGKKTPMSAEPRWMQFHRLAGLDTDKEVFYRMSSR